VLRDALFGLRRFDEFRASLGIASNVLAARLDRLCTEGLLQRQAYQARPERHEYLLTDQGRDLAPALLMIMKWGDRYYPNPAGPPRVAVQRTLRRTARRPAQLRPMWTGGRLPRRGDAPRARDGPDRAVAASRRVTPSV
jgi:DNA-binding HxlR family transcriptional regulator